MRTINQVSSGGIVYKKVGDQILWLITQHSQHKGWVFPKGLVGDNNKNESKEIAALREVEEEGGVKAKIVNDKPIVTNYEYKWQSDLIKKTVYYYLMEYVSGDPKDHDWEMMDGKFAPADVVKKTLTYGSDKVAFEKIIQGL